MPDINVGNFVSSVQARLKDSVVGYSFVIGGAKIPAVKYSYGQARTTANGTALNFSSSVSSGVGSVSKFITAIAAVQLLDRPDAGGVVGWNIMDATLDTPMYKALPPYWKLRNDIQKITFRHLLTHTSGLAAEGAKGEPGDDYFSLKTYLSPTQAPGTPPLGTLGSYAYSNVGFCLFRLLLPNIVGLVPTSDPGQYEQERSLEYALQFQNILQDNIWGQLGITGPTLSTPPGDDHAFMYFNPVTIPGYDWSQFKYSGQILPEEGQLLIAGAGTQWMSIDHFTELIDSINKGDHRILTDAQWSAMQGIGAPPGFEGYGFGIDNLTINLNGTQYRWVEKNGGLSWDIISAGGQLSASVAFFGDMESGTDPNQGPFYAALFINSNIWGGPGSSNTWFYCSKCNSLFNNASGGNICPANGKAHTQGGNYTLSNKKQTGWQGFWQECTKCSALCHDPTATDPSKCAGNNGGRHVPSGESFVLDQSGQSALTIQNEWRWCKNCGVLAYSGGNASAGVCAAGGAHQFILSDSNYSLQETVGGADTVLLEAFSKSIG
jgi:CubicO group peptidase (beta-lactamase class C family)